MEAVHRNILTRLVDLGLIRERELIDGSVILGNGRQRNRFFYCKRRQAPSLFMKQACGEGGAEKSLMLEANVYRCAASDPDCVDLREVMPHLLHFDETSSMLITEMFVDTVDLGTAMRRDGAFDLAGIRQFGAAAARIHSASLAPFQHEATHFDGKPHWIYRLLDTPSPLPSLRGRSPASARLIDTLLADPAVVRTLSRLAQGWRRTHLIHGDYKWENAIRLDDADRSIRIIDWEQANLGDPAWDLGYGLAAIVVHAVVHAAIVGDDSSLGSRPLALIEPMRCFWGGYLDRRASEGEEASTLLRRAVEMMGARLLVAAFELCYAQDEIPANSASLLRDARYVLDQGASEIAQAIEGANHGEPPCMH